MPEFNIIKYSEINSNEWEKFIDNSNNGTIFHRLKFLHYHGNKFQDNVNHLILKKRNSLFGVLPLAIFNENGNKIAKSPYGASYGGWVFTDTLNYSNSKKIVLTFIEYMKNMGINEIIITPSISISNKNYCETFNFTMMEHGFKIINSDITSIVSLNENDNRHKMFSQRKRNIARKARKARENHVETVKNSSIDDFWIVLEETFQKHKAVPTHTIDEFKLLNKLFPNDIYTDIAIYNNVPIAGIGYINLNNFVKMSFYLCSSEKYKETQALSLLIYEALLASKEQGYRYFDFGTSSYGMIGREGVFRFKESFGAFGEFRKTFGLKVLQ